MGESPIANWLECKERIFQGFDGALKGRYDLQPRDIFAVFHYMARR
tara:strand:+ start:424 stop:561 length:138 start_codon:yes stop_codon:yes gene_type:complete